jgi:hypothetical protein
MEMGKQAPSVDEMIRNAGGKPRPPLDSGDQSAEMNLARASPNFFPSFASEVAGNGPAGAKNAFSFLLCALKPVPPTQPERVCG